MKRSSRAYKRALSRPATNDMLLILSALALGSPLPADVTKAQCALVPHQLDDAMLTLLCCRSCDGSQLLDTSMVIYPWTENVDVPEDGGERFCGRCWTPNECKSLGGTVVDGHRACLRTPRILPRWL